MFNLSSIICTEIPHPIGVRAEVSADNTSIRVSWMWLCRCLLTYLDLVRVHYQPKGGSVKMYTVDNTTATGSTLSNIQCDTKYTVWVYVESGSNEPGNMSVPRMVSIPARGK